MSYEIMPNRALTEFNNLLIRRGLRFPIFARYRQLLGYDRSWSVIFAEFISSLCLWIILLIGVEDVNAISFTYFSIVAASQIAYLPLFWGVVSIFRYFWPQQTTNNDDEEEEEESKLGVFFWRVIMAFVSIFSIYADLITLSGGISLANIITDREFILPIISHPLLQFLQTQTVILERILAATVVILSVHFLFETFSKKMSSLVGRQTILTITLICATLFKSISVFLFANYTNDREYLQLISLSYLLSTPIFFALTFLYSTLSTSLMAFPHMVRIRTDILGLTFLAATIPFLNADSWQLISGINWRNLGQIALLVYFIPVASLLYSRHRLLVDELYEHTLKGDKRVGFSAIERVYLRTSLAGEPAIDKYFRSRSFDSITLSEGDKRILIVKTVIKGVLVLLFLPLIVFVFAFILFQTAINDQVLTEWLTGKFETFLSNSIIDGIFVGLLVLKIKAALLLSIFSSTSTISTLITSDDLFRQFLRQEFGNDIKEDRQLLLINRFLEK